MAKSIFSSANNAFKDAFSKDKAFGTVAGVANAASGAIGNAISGGYSSGVGNAMQGLSSIASAIPGPYGAIASTALNIAGGAINGLFGTKVDTKALNEANSQTNTLRSFNSNASTFDDVKGLTATTNIGNVYKGGIFNKKGAAKKNAELQRQRDEALAFADRSIDNNIANIQNTQTDNLMANFAAYGGPLEYDMQKTYLDNMYMNAGNSKLTSLPNSFQTPSNQGLYAFGFGGDLQTQGGDFSNGLTWINEGGSHEQNPQQGVPMGIAPDGQPNLVEEGEVVFEDYVFSNRLKVPKKLRERLKLKDDSTFADAAKKVSKESEERPNDPISQAGLKASMDTLLVGQEEIRQRRRDKQVAKQTQEAVAQQQQMMDQGMVPQEGMPQDVLEQQQLPQEQLSQEQMAAQELAQQGNREYEIGGPLNEEYGYTQSLPHATFFDTPVDYTSTSDNGPSYGDYVKWYKENNYPEQDLYKEDYWKAHQDAPLTQMYLEDRGFNSNVKQASGDNIVVGTGRKIKNNLISPVKISDAPLTMPVIQSEVVQGTRIETPTPTITAKKLSPIETTKPEKDKSYATWMRYVPALGGAFGFASSFLPTDYSNADRLSSAASNFAINASNGGSDVEFKPIGNYLTYRPDDINYEANQLRASEQATARNILNTAGGNRGSAMAGLLANGYNSQLALGNAYRNAFLANREQEQKVEDFNRATNITNSQGFLDAAKARLSSSLQAQGQYLSAIESAAKMRQNIDDAKNAARSANLTNLVNSIGDIGRENMAFNMVNNNRSQYYGINRDGTIYYKPAAYDSNGKLKQEAIDELSNSATNGKKSAAYGGMLTKRSKKGGRK